MLRFADTCSDADLHWVTAPHLLTPNPIREASAEYDLKSNDHPENSNDVIFRDDLGESKGKDVEDNDDLPVPYKDEAVSPKSMGVDNHSDSPAFRDPPEHNPTDELTTATSSSDFEQTIRFAADPRKEQASSSKALHIPPPWKRDRGKVTTKALSKLMLTRPTGSSIVEVDDRLVDCGTRTSSFAPQFLRLT